jgi:hypothetical protein
MAFQSFFLWHFEKISQLYCLIQPLGYFFTVLLIYIYLESILEQIAKFTFFISQDRSSFVHIAQLGKNFFISVSPRFVAATAMVSGSIAPNTGSSLLPT